MISICVKNVRKKMSEGKDTIGTMKEYYVLTGELVKIVAKDEDEMWDKLSNGDYEEQETLSEIQDVYDVKE
jgi:hypothetical protein